MKNLFLVGSIVLSALHVAPANAVDGVKLLGQPKKFPIVLSAPGSYRLRRNIILPNADTTAIAVKADNVTIDLNGFSILGPCTGGPPCTPAGAGIGVDALSTGNRNTTVLNGTVQGMGGGVWLISGRVDGVSAVSNAMEGISGSPDSVPGLMVANSRAIGNGSFGIAAAGGTVTNCAADSNLDGGIYGTTVTNSTAINTLAGGGVGGNDGISADTVINSTATGNAGNGITAGTVTGCTADSNGATGIQGFGSASNSTGSGNVGDGIDATTVTGCTATDNGGTGILAFGSASNSTASNNTGSQITAPGITGHNTCNGSPCP